MPTSFAIGWKPDRPDARDFDAAKTLLRAAPPPPDAAMNDDLVMIVDQRQLGACTVNAAGQAVRAAEMLELLEKAQADFVAAGNDPSAFDARAALSRIQATLEFWSRLMMYYLARSYDHDTGNDSGTEERLVFKAANEYGFCAESVWPYIDTGTLFTKMPSANAFRLAYDARASVANDNANLLNYARITSTGAQRTVDIKTAVAARHLVVFGTLVTKNFCSDGSGNGGRVISKPASATKDIAGGHALCVGGYDAGGAKIINSWSKAYGGRGGLPPGWCKFGWDYMEWEETSDLWIVRRAPFLAAKAA